MAITTPTISSGTVDWANPDVDAVPHIAGPIPGPQSRAYRDRALQYAPIATPAPNLLPITFKSGRGATLTDADDNVYIDLSGGTSVANIGHAHPKVAEALAKVSYEFSNVHDFPTVYKADAFEQLSSVTPDGMNTFAFFSSGTEAIEGAMRVAREVTGRDGFISLFNDFHGRTSGAAGVSATQASNGMRAPGSIIVPNGCTEPDGTCANGVACDLRCANVAELMIKQNLPGKLAGLVLEIIQNGYGSTTYQPGYVARLAEIVRSNGGLLAADEIATGFGRTGTWWAHESEGVVPEIMAIGKGMGNGFPVSAVVVRDEYREALDRSMPSSSYGANPMACAVVSEIVRVMKEENLVEHAAEVGSFAKARMHEIADRHHIVGHVRGRGLLLNFDIVRDRASMEPAHDLTEMVFRESTQRGVMWTTSTNQLKIKPPIVISEALMGKALDIIEESIEVVEHRLGY